MRYGLLGPLEVTDDAGHSVDLGGRQPRLVLTVLLVSAGRRVTAESLIDATWGEDPPASAPGTLQSYVSRLRSRLGASVLVWDENGYRLDVDPDLVDHLHFEALADQGGALLASGQVEVARSTLVDALSLWRGRALGEFADLEFAVGLASRLEQRRLAAVEDRFEADLLLGRHAAVAAELAEAVTAHPLRERLQHQHALALYRSGRQADALRALADAGRHLREELGIEPGRELRDLERAILDQDPGLDAPSPPAAAEAGGSPAPGTGRTSPRRRSTDVAPGPAAAAPVPLIGREAELGVLLSALAEAATEARFVVVEGEPGIGKTRLAEELRGRAEADGGVAVWGRSDEGGAAPALWPWLPPLRALAAEVDDVPPLVADLIAGDAPVASGQADEVRFGRFEAVADLLAVVAARRRVTVLLDDLQWADAASLELLGFLAGRLAPGVLVVGTLRQLEVGTTAEVTAALAAIARRPGSRRIRLRGLAPDATADVLDRAAGRHLEPEVAAVIHQRAEGNPFYAIELARLLGAEGDPVGEVPGSVSDVIRRRLAQLPPATHGLLEVAAVIGREVGLERLAAAVGRPLGEVLDDLDPAVAHRVLVEAPDLPGSLRFSHALVREVLLDDLTALRRARLHLQVADAIESAGAGVDDVEILAEHLWQAAPVGVGRRAAAALERAAAVALGRVAYAAAEAHLAQAVQLRRATGSTEEDLHAELDAIIELLSVSRSRSYFQGANDGYALERGRELAERLGRRSALLDVLWFDVARLATAARVVEAAPVVDAFVAVVADDPDPLARAAGFEVLGIQRWGEGRIREAVELLDRAVALNDSAPTPTDTFALERQMVTRTFWLWHHAAVGDWTPEDVFAAFDGLLAVLPDRYSVASICGFAMTTAITLGRWAELERYATIARDADPESQFGFWAGQLDMQEAIALARRGDVDAAIEQFARGRDGYTSLGGRSGLTTFTAALAEQLARHGRAAEARVEAEAARRELEAYQERWNEPAVLLAEAALAGAEGDEIEQQRLLEETAALAEAQGAHAVAARARQGLPPQAKG